MIQAEQNYQSQEQSQQLPIYPIETPIPELPNQDFFRFRIDNTEILEEVMHQLRGEVFIANENGQGGEYKKVFDRWINEEGLNKISYIIYCCGINKNTLLGNLSKDEIYFKCQALKIQLSQLLFKKYKEFEVKKEMRELLVTAIMNTVHSALSRSEGGKEADDLSKATQRHEIVNQDLTPKETSNPFARLLRRRKV
jgi:hypothetical protein